MSDPKKAIILDLDGTVYNGDKLIDGADESIERFRDSGFGVVFCTNNSTMTIGEIRSKLNNMGIVCEDKDIYSSGMATVRYLKSTKPGKIWLIGSDNLRSQISLNNEFACNPEDAETLVVGMDFDYNYEKIKNGMRAAIAAEKIVFCGEDPFFIGHDGMLYPGCAAMTSTIRACSLREPDIIIGKPYEYMMQLILEDNGLKAENVVVIGDSFETDAMFAKNNGVHSILIGKSDNSVKSVKRLKDVDVEQLFEVI